MRVKVSDSLLRADLRGLEGTIAEGWGSPGFLAFEVLLEDGRSELFWQYELEEIEGVT